MSITFNKEKSGYIRMTTDTPEERVLGEFLLTDVAHMPSVIKEILSKEHDEQVIMDACRIATQGDTINIHHLYLEDLPVFKSSKQSLLEYIAQWEQFLSSQVADLTLALN
jgi:hypothetical protein